MQWYGSTHYQIVANNGHIIRYGNEKYQTNSIDAYKENVD